MFCPGLTTQPAHQGQFIVIKQPINYTFLGCGGKVATPRGNPCTQRKHAKSTPIILSVGEGGVVVLDIAK